MNSTQVISFLLLIGRLITVSFMVLVISKQFRVLKAKNYPELTYLRLNLLRGSVVILLGNLVPIIIDVMGIMGKGSFNLLLAYVFSNNITAMVSAYMLWYNINLAEKILIVDTHRTNMLAKDKAETDQQNVELTAKNLRLSKRRKK